LHGRDIQCAERPIWGWAAAVFREESSRGTGRTLRGKGPGANVRITAIMSGTAILQQGLTTTCTDPRISLVESDGRSLVGRMSPYERRRRGNALPGRARHDPDKTVTPGVRQRGSGHLAVSGPVNWVTGSNRTLEQSVRGQPSVSGADVSQRLNLITAGKACTGEPRSEPDSGNPTVRDRRGARGTMAMGVGLRPTTKGVDEPPNPNARAPRIYPDSCKIVL
jgi:hypothetical protein